MPEISRFFGIKIFMFNTSREHNPLHFHATYQGYKASFDFNGELKEGYMPKSRQNLFLLGL